MEVLERSLKDERCLCLRMRVEDKKIVVIGCKRSGTAVPTWGTDCANLLEFFVGLAWFIWHVRANVSTGGANLLDLGLQNFSSFFLNRTQTITYKTLKTTTKNRQNKSR
jgi:hypothetical protein